MAVAVSGTAVRLFDAMAETTSVRRLPLQVEAETTLFIQADVNKQLVGIDL